MAANMNPKFQASVQSRDDVTYVKLSGVIDEDNELGTLADKLGTGTAVIDVSEIERINSCGVRDWVNWLGKAEKGGAKVVLVECSPAIVAQINLVNNFTGQGVVKSFYAPYFCPNCDLEKVLLVETRDLYSIQPFKAPSCRCDECDGPMDFDDMEECHRRARRQRHQRVHAHRRRAQGAAADQPRRVQAGRRLAAVDPVLAERAHRDGERVVEPVHLVDLGDQRLRRRRVDLVGRALVGGGGAGGARGAARADLAGAAAAGQVERRVDRRGGADRDRGGAARLRLVLRQTLASGVRRR
jgi:anti-anti-sigma regulatory factor